MKKKKKTTDKKIFLCNLIAQYRAPKEIKELSKSIHGWKIANQTIDYYRTKYPELIGELRDKYLASVSEIPIAQKKVRLERTECLYRYATTIKAKKDMVDTSLKCLSAAREEIEGKSMGNISLTQINQFSQMTDDQLVHKRKELRDQLKKLMQKETTEVEYAVQTEA